MFGDTKRRLAHLEYMVERIFIHTPYEHYTATDVLTETAKALHGGEIPDHQTVTVTGGFGFDTYHGTRYTAAGIGKALADGLTNRAESDLVDESPAYEPMTLPDDVREMLTAQMGRLDKLAATLVLDDDAMPLGGMASITQSMCEIAKELRE